MNINGNVYKWSDVTVRILGKNRRGIVGINYERTQTKTNLYGAGNDPVARSHGQNEYKASITLTLNEVHDIEKDLPTSTSILDIAPFDVIVSYVVSGNTIRKDIISECEFTGNKREFSNSNSEFQVEFELIVGGITFNA